MNAYTHICCHTYSYMGWLWLVGSIRLWVSFANEPYKRNNILQKRPIISTILLTVAKPYMHIHIHLRVEASWQRHASPYNIRVHYTYMCIHMCTCTYISIYICVYIHMSQVHTTTHKGWLWTVGSRIFQVSFAKEPCYCRALLQTCSDRVGSLLPLNSTGADCRSRVGCCI